MNSYNHMMLQIVQNNLTYFFSIPQNATFDDAKIVLEGMTKQLLEMEKNAIEKQNPQPSQPSEEVAQDAM